MRLNVALLMAVLSPSLVLATTNATERGLQACVDSIILSNVTFHEACVTDVMRYVCAETDGRRVSFVLFLGETSVVAGDTPASPTAWVEALPPARSCPDNLRVSLTNATMPYPQFLDEICRQTKLRWGITPKAVVMGWPEQIVEIEQGGSGNGRPTGARP